MLAVELSARALRASRLIASTSSSSHSPSCSTSTVPRIVPSTRTSRRSGAAESPRGLSVVTPSTLRAKAECGEDGVCVGRDRREPRDVALHRLRPRAGDDEDDARARRDLAAGHALGQRTERGAARAVGFDAGRVDEERRVLHDHVLGDGDDVASGRARGADREVAVRRIADGERGDAGRGLDA